MALLAAESFDNSNTSVDFVLNGSVSINTTGGVYNTGCAFVGNSTSAGVNYISRYFRPLYDASSNNTINFSFWFKASGPPTGSNYYKFVLAVDSRYGGSSTGPGLFIYSTTQSPTGCILLGNGSGRDTGGIDTSRGPSICDNQWHFIECNFQAAFTGSQSVPSYGYVYQDGRLVCSGSVTWGTFTRYDTINFFNLIGNGCRYWIDDLTVWDQTGTTFVGYPKGPIRIQTIRPTYDVSSINVKSTAATNYETLDETNGANYTDYITLSNTANALFGVSNLASDTENVFGLITTAYFNSGQGGRSNVKIGHQIGSTFSYTGAQTYFSQSYFSSISVIENNFITNESLTVQNVNDLIVSVDRIP